MMLIIGLGNPGKKYVNNRHNVGYMFVDYLIKKLRITDYGLKIVKADCFMNESGIFVKKLIRNSKFAINNLIIIHDDLDIPLGKFHIQFGICPQLHNGLESIENHLHSKDFWRVRIGIDNRQQEEKTSPERSRTSIPLSTTLSVNRIGRRIPGEIYTLQNFLSQEKKLLEMEIFPKIFSQLKLNFKML